ncbi:hypothetical protein K461DRAFT_270782 [Myriangium duriaei CBS 260.36]|uniref:Uncharacterized protein n=1 Tax=Myriangium duriaei CBS 260.36 TaxID=1168546 RepID=A0A9P4IV77_9PEZI|nr:hypothetical protein K461DRAFT_270782 [Myriangium duriaei CBS 260.36]
MKNISAIVFAVLATRSVCLADLVIPDCPKGMRANPMLMPGTKLVARDAFGRTDGPKAATKPIATTTKIARMPDVVTATPTRTAKMPRYLKLESKQEPAFKKCFQSKSMHTAALIQRTIQRLSFDRWQKTTGPEKVEFRCHEILDHR